jgi:hypothetical protein
MFGSKEILSSQFMHLVDDGGTFCSFGVQAGAICTGWRINYFANPYRNWS